MISSIVILIVFHNCFEIFTWLLFIRLLLICHLTLANWILFHTLKLYLWYLLIKTSTFWPIIPLNCWFWSLFKTFIKINSRIRSNWITFCWNMCRFRPSKKWLPTTHLHISGLCCHSSIFIFIRPCRSTHCIIFSSLIILSFCKLLCLV